VLKAATGRVANLLNEGTPTHRLPPEILAKILYLAVDHGSEEYAGQVIPLTHVCTYWRTLLLSYPRIWSTLCLKPGNPRVISEWLTRSQNAPLTVIAEFTDAYEHPLCRYEDLTTATLADTYDLEVCPRHEAILSLDQLLLHRSRIRDLTILVHLSDPDWQEDDSSGEPGLLYHHFFKRGLPNLQRLDFRAAHVERTRYVIPIPDSLFAGNLPRLEELKYLGVSGGLTKTATKLVSCEFGFWSKSAGPTIIAPGVLQTLFYNNKTVKSLTITECEFFAISDAWIPTAIPMKNLKYLEIHCSMDDVLQKIVNCIHAPQFRSLDTVQLSLFRRSVRVVATDGSGHTFKFSQPIGGDPSFDPLRHLGANITTLRLDRGMTHPHLDDAPSLYKLVRSFDAVRVLEFDGAVVSVDNVITNLLSVVGVLPWLEVIRVAVSPGDCRGALQLLGVALMLRRDEGKPLTAIEPLMAEDEDGLGRELRMEWEKHYEVEEIQKLLSE